MEFHHNQLLNKYINKLIMHLEKYLLDNNLEQITN